ncbi:MAG: hypothetical protein QXH32_02320 [Candidatus Caldarchaeum sp.]
MNWIELKKLIDEEAERIRLSAPDEVKKIFKYGLIESEAGSYGQYFSTMVFAEGDIRALAYYNLNNLLFLIDEGDFTLEQLKKLFRLYVPLSSEFLSYCGFKRLWEFVRQTLQVLDELKDKEELKQLLTSLALYVAHLHSWVHFAFPWHLGILFRRPSAEDIREFNQLAQQTKL